jgi:predicted nucleic acid-binding protein
LQKPKIYLETTLFNYYFDTDRDAHADTVQLFTEVAEGKFEAFTSEAVTGELNDAPLEKRKKMFALLDMYPIQMLPISDVEKTLADLYVAEGIIPSKYRTDGVHIAVAAVNGLDFIISMNFKHIVKPKVKRLANAVNIVKGYRPVEIISPMEVTEHEDT